MGKSKKSKRPFFVTMGIAMMLLLGLIFMLNKLQEDKPAIPFDLTGQPTIGSPNAKVSIVEFGNYNCVACKYWEMDIFPQLKREFMDTGQAKFSFINYPFNDSSSQMAAYAGEEVFRQNPDAFWKFHEALYNAQSSKHEEWLTVPILLDIAKQSSPEIDLKRLEKAVLTRSTEPAIVQDLKLANRAQISATPKVFVNGREFEGTSYDALRSFIEAAQSELQ